MTTPASEKECQRPFRFTLYGDPVTAKGVRAAVLAGHLRTYAPKGVNAWKASVIMQVAALHAPEFTGPVGVIMCCHFKRPTSHPKTKQRPHVVKPDLDNIYSRIMDAIEQAPGLFVHDQQIVWAQLSKCYAGPAEPTRIEITMFDATTCAPSGMAEYVATRADGG